MSKFPEQKEREFQELVSYVSLFATSVWGIPAESPLHPSHFVTPVRGKISKSQLLAGLQQAARDTIEAAQSFQPEQIAALDNECRIHHVLTLTEVRQRYGRKILKQNGNPRPARVMKDREHSEPSE